MLSRVLFSSPMVGIGSDIKNKAKKLHIQFCHPTADRLIKLLINAGTHDQNIHDVIREVTSQCDTCIRNKKAPLRPAVGFPLATQFNEMVAIDLKSRGQDGYILHIIDHLTRYSNACLIKNKRKETIVKAIMDHWIRIFGSPKSFLTDNGGEFINQEFIDLAEKFNIVLKTTAAESAWSNGLCERHNGILNNNVNKILENEICSLEVAIAWAISAKNSLANVYGFSPNMLVFGRNPNFPTAFTNKPPGNNMTCLNEYVAQNLNAMHSARQAFVEQESSERLRRALNRKSRTYSNRVYCQGNQVYYWRKDQSDCHGPAVVVGKDGQQILLKHGGMYIRVHPCRMQPCSTEQLPTTQSDKETTDHNHPTSPVSSGDDNYITADEQDGDDFTDAPASTPESDRETSAAASSHSDVNDREVENWTHISNHRDLPKNGSTIKCLFPGYEDEIICKILSRGGKSTTSNWHFLNIQEDGENVGKCCSFKDAKWKTLPDEENASQPTFSETFYGESDPLFNQAKIDEINKWNLFETFIEFPDRGEKTISTRWVCTRKIKGGKVVHKARLVARGFEENSKFLQTDSPTCSKESLRMLLCIISSHSWVLHSLDVKSAFLQGENMTREVYIKPPKEANTKSLWKMLRCPYGLADAGRHWYLRLKTELIQAGMTISKLDQALFMWYSNDELSGILVCHVDDILFGGNLEFHNQVISRLRCTFSIGLEENTNLKYLGLNITQSSNGIKVSTSEYAKSLKEINLSGLNSEGKEGFSPDQITILRQFTGQINWLTTQGRPDIGFDSCFLANSLKSGNHSVFSFANKLIRKVQNQDTTLNFPSNFDMKTCAVVTFTDASFANLPNAGSQGSFVSLLIDQNGIYCPVAWQSRKIRRVVKSTLAAECLAAVEAAEISIYIASVLKEILQYSIDTCVYCDNQNLVKAVHSSTNLEDKRLIIDISILRDMLEQNELTHLKWVPTEHQLANSLTKQGASNKLLLSVFNDNNLRFHKNHGIFK